MTISTYNRITDSNSDGAGINAAIRSHISELGTNTLVQVKAVYAGSGITGTVDVQPMVHMQTTGGDTIPHGTIYGVPYLRVQGGANALIIDPVVGDIGYIIISGRDQTNAIANRAPSDPGSFRSHNMADCVYIGAYLGNDPTNYIRVSGGSVTLNSSNVYATANLGAANGATGSFTTPMGQTVTVRNGLITNIY